MLEVLDMPDTHESCGRRNQTITAPQALSLLNDKLTLEWAQAFAGRVLQQCGNDVTKSVQQAFRLAYGRIPDGWEKDTVLTFLEKQKGIISDRLAANEKVALPFGTLPSGIEPATAAAMVDFCHMLLNSNEFVYRN